MRAVCGMTVVVALLVAPASGMAQTKLPVGKAHGVRIVRDNGALVVVFTDRAAKRYRRIAGKLVEVECTDQAPADPRPRAFTFIGPSGPGDITGEGSGGVTMRAPSRGRRLVTGDLTRGLDYCRVWLKARTVRRNGERRRIERRMIVSVPLTQSGAVFLDEESKARRLLSLIFAAGSVGERLHIDGWPSHTQLVGTVPELRHFVVALASPADTPPPRTIGYYSDRSEHIAVVMLSRSGRRLFIEATADVLSTNVAGYVFADR